MQASEPAEVTPEQCRKTLWRQGHVLPPSVAADLGLAPDRRYMIVTHDCDLAQPVDVEPDIEIIAAKAIDTINPLCSLGENPRVLHLELTNAGEAPLRLDLRATEKCRLSKAALFSNSGTPPPRLADKQRQLLQSWLACRYRRHALPNALNNYLESAYKKLRKTAKKKPDGVIATWIKYDPDREPKQPGELYELSFTVVYQSESPGGERNAKAMAERLNTALKDAEGIDYQGAEVESDTTFTKFRERQMWEWHMEFISFRGEQTGALAQRY